jgi:integrase
MDSDTKPDITFAQHADQYIARLGSRRRKSVKPTSVAAFRAALRMAAPILGDLPLVAIESEQVRQLVEYLVHPKYAPNTIRLVVRTAKKVIASAVDERGNPAIVRTWNDDYIDTPRAENRTVSELLAPAQIEAAISQAGPVIREFIITQAASGLRKGELLALTVEDFDSVLGVLHVARTRGYFGETKPKTKSGERNVDLHPRVTATLIRLLAGRTTGRLFDVSIDEIRRAFERLGLKSHALRHFRYTHLQNSAVPNPIRDFWLGHSVAGMERIYGHQSENVELRQKLARQVGLGFTLPAVSHRTVPEQLQMAAQA